jgi:hypothetical protein
MTEIRRMVEGDATEFEKWLLSTAARERPTPRQRRRMWHAILLGQIGVATTGFSAAASTMVHIVVAALVAGAVATGGDSPVVARAPNVIAFNSAPSAPRGSPRVISTKSDTTRSTELPEPASATRGTDLPEPATATRGTDLPEPATATRGTNLPEPATATRGTELPQREADGTAKRDPLQRTRLVSPLPPTAKTSEGELRDEIRLLDGVRASLRSSDPRAALSALDDYRQRFPRGAFGQEAAVLRIEALAVAGQKTAAATLAKAFIAAHPSSPHIDRLRPIAGELPSKP